MKTWKHMKTHEKTLLAAGMPAECVYFFMSPVVSGTVPPPKLHGFALEVYQLRGKYPNRDYPHIFKAQIRNLESSFEHSVGSRKWGSGKSQPTDIELDPESVGYDNVWQCMTMYDMWIQAPPMNSSYSCPPRSFEKTTNVAVQDARVGPEAEKLFAEAKEMLVGNPGCFPAVTHPSIYIYI